MERSNAPYLLPNMAVVLCLLFSAMTWATETAASAQGAPEDTDTGAAPWKFRLTPFGWVPSEADFHVTHGATNEHGSLTLDHIAKALKGVAEVRGEVRKGSIGGFVSLMYLQLNGHRGNQVSIDGEDQVYYWNYGVTYEVGRWNLGDAPGATAVTVEPYVAGRTLRDSVRINIFSRTDDVELDFTTPVIGVNTYWDLNERWNFFLSGDFGGFDVDDVHQTWQITGTVGYRFHIGSLPANFMAGYRMLFVDYREDGAVLDINVHGPIVGLALDF